MGGELKQTKKERKVSEGCMAMKAGERNQSNRSADTDRALGNGFLIRGI